ncbi:LamG-like jellyroll fold domain-containing protein [Streptomyces triticiradicis]|uniref:Glycoside hydrolase family 2 n=1 Tax=Streptomyces triticiradicis TaxID=2651189 RepID=A0A7J5D8E7_9ACTN|nr:LamG-like jellyroll fold domain-containing protein [Streptomyces triticiradicis]KAB1982802.1 glycoside hydrolase family 2 [Streptomyces triticiradicis]
MTRHDNRPRTRVLALLATAALVLPPSGLLPVATAAATTGSASALAAGQAAVETHGLKGEYFSMSAPGARDFAQLGGTTLDPQVNFSGLTDTFKELTGKTEHTTARWTGQIEAPATDDYTFYAIGDNGFRLFIDDEPVIDHWVGDWDREQTSRPVRLTAGEKHTFRLELFQDTGGANMYLRWSTPTLAKQIVPMSAFTPPADFEVFPVELTVAENGRRLRARFEGRAGGIQAVKDHLKVEADTTAMPIGSVASVPGDPSSVYVNLSEPVQKNQLVRVSYDGEGGLTAGGKAVPKVIRYAENGSTHRLTTKWGDQVDKKHPLPEYPRPQQKRSKWANLNGPWQFSGAKAGEQPVFGKNLDEKIIVPFAVESQLSGLERHEDHMFYRRLIDVPKDWKVGKGDRSNRLKLNFGAVDYQARVYVNGTKVADHTGGYNAFSADITDALKGSGKQEIVVAVTDTGGADQPTGKQSTNPGGIFYTQTSGIWQTVWMEPVAPASIENLVTTPDIDTGTLAVTVDAQGASSSARVEAVARDAHGKVVGRVSGAADEKLSLPVAKQHLWSPDDPYLYDLDVTLTDGRSHDRVRSYFGMRKIGVEKVGGFDKLVLNGKPVFSLATLDQGFWPDGLYTAPSDDALAFDLEAHKKLGFNAVRKHIKVEPARWFYHADKLGLLVWQDFVSGNLTNETGRKAFVDQGREMMRQHHNSPSVIGWIVFNEGWGEWNREETGRITEAVKAADPSRVVNAHSGVNCCNSKGDSGKGDIIDHHDYNNDDPSFPDGRRAAMDGEHGGFTLRSPGHMWPGAPTVIYSGVTTKADLTRRYVENTEKFYVEQAGAELSGSVYTQITDLENELNGLYTYDRRDIKVDAAEVRKVNLKVIAAGAAAGQKELKGGRWTLDEGTGTTAGDSGPDGTPLTLREGASWTDGISGSALKFDGQKQYAQTSGPVLDTSGSYSVSAWVRLDGLPGNYATAVSQDTRALANSFYLQYGHGNFAFSTPDERRAQVSVPAETGRWYHLVGVRDAGTGQIRLYLDGKLAATATGGTALPSTGPLTVGRAHWDGSNVDFWNGAVDEVHAVDRALSAEEVSSLYSEEKP